MMVKGKRRHLDRRGFLVFRRLKVEPQAAYTLLSVCNVFNVLGPSGQLHELQFLQ